jgi:uncharacterized membrane protein
MSDQERKDELKSEEYYERKSTTDNNKSDSSPSSSPKTKGIKDKIVGKISSTTMGKSQEENNVNLSESARVSNNVRTVILGLFILIAFIILVFAVFTASVGAQLGQVQFANSVFIAAIVGAFTLVGVIVSQIRGSNGR